MYLSHGSSSSASTPWLEARSPSHVSASAGSKSGMSPQRHACRCDHATTTAIILTNDIVLYLSSTRVSYR